jgi:hypothetical protein
MRETISCNHRCDSYVSTIVFVKCARSTHAMATKAGCVERQNIPSEKRGNTNATRGSREPQSDIEKITIPKGN